MAKRKRHAGRRLLSRFKSLESRQLLAADLQRVIRLSVLVSAIWTIVTISDCHGSEQRFQSLLSEKCLDCHSGEEAEADLQLDALAADLPWVRNRDTWRRLIQLVEMHSMPPDVVVDISSDERGDLVDHIKHSLESFDYSNIKDPGHEPIRRLTHREYQNTLNDLMGTDIAIVDRFPRELIGSTGFDNDAATLSFQAALMERYIPIAENAVSQSSARWDSIESDAIAEKSLRRFVGRAFRRRPTKSELESALGGFRRSRKEGQSIMDSLQREMKATLLSPSFLMRVEISPQGDSTQISDYALASRLSYFLWSSMPDNDLFRLATRNQLSTPATLKEQIERMLADPKAARFSEAFVGQWLSTNLIGREIRHDPIDEPWCTDSLMDAMRAETRQLFHEILTANRPATDLIEADFTYVTAELADTLYGLRTKNHEGLQCVSLKHTSRRGSWGMPQSSRRPRG